MQFFITAFGSSFLYFHSSFLYSFFTFMLLIKIFICSVSANYSRHIKNYGTEFFRSIISMYLDLVGGYPQYSCKVLRTGKRYLCNRSFEVRYEQEGLSQTQAF